MLLLAGQRRKHDQPQIADQLHLSALGFQRKNVVLIEHGGCHQHVIVFGILAGVLVGHQIQSDFHQPVFAREIFSFCGNAVELIGHGYCPWKGLEGLCGFSLKVEMVRLIFRVKLKDGFAVRSGWLSAIGEIVDLVIVAVIRHGRGAI